MSALVSILLMLFDVAPAVGVTANVRRFESRYSSATTLQATFLERYAENGRVARAEAGAAYFRRPGRMRWEYESPEQNLFLVDGKWAWFYVPADHTATRVPAKRSNDWRTPIALLADNPRLSKICSQVAASVTVEADSPRDVVLFCAMRGAAVSGHNIDPADDSARALESRVAAQGDAVFLELQPQTGVLARVLITQPGGVSIEFKFSNWQFNPVLSDSLFRFEPPTGVAIVNGELSPEGLQ